MRVLSIVGARPQFVKAAEFARACREGGVEHALVHTGQHYDDGLSRTFFDELEIPEPVVNLGVGSGSHARQTGEIMRRLDSFLYESRSGSDWMVLFGDTNSTLASGLVASKRGLPVAHVEAGLRSYDNRMSEEINRVLTDRLSTLLFCPTRTSVDNLTKEGIEDGVCLTGDIMFDSILRHKDRAARLHPHPMDGEPFILATIHRADNTDDRSRLRDALSCLAASGLPVLWPVHPRAAARMASFGLSLPANVRSVPPVGYLRMLAYLEAAHRVVTDSGGVQKEAFWLGTPCITLRTTTEWPETLEGGWNVLVDVDLERFKQSLLETPSAPRRNQFGEGGAGAEMMRRLRTFSDL